MPAANCVSPDFFLCFYVFVAYLLRMMSDYKVETINDGLSEFNVMFNGPKDSMLSTSRSFAPPYHVS